MDTGVVADGVIGRAIGGRSRRRHGRDAVVGVNAVILQAFWQNSHDGRMGHDGRRSRCFGRRTEAGSTGDAAGETAVATTGVATTTAARCMTGNVHVSRASWEVATSKKCIGTVHDYTHVHNELTTHSQLIVCCWILLESWSHH